MRQLLNAATAEDTEACGARLAQLLPADPPLLQVQLHGDLGAGKTTLARGFLHGLGYSGVVRSPTYTLLEIYVLGALTVVHADLYRLHDPDEFPALGLRDLAAPGHIWLIEWPERAGSWLPPPDVDITLAAHASSHSIEVHAQSLAGARWLAPLRA